MKEAESAVEKIDPTFFETPEYILWKPSLKKKAPSIYLGLFISWNNAYASKFWNFIEKQLNVNKYLKINK